MADILIVDDDEELADTLAEVLVELGHAVRVARNGYDGLAALEDGPLPDVVILDVEMPVLDGPGMAGEMLVRNCGKEQIPIILVSGYVDLHATADRVGTPYFAPKPCPLDTLLGLLDRALRERRAPVPAAARAPEPPICRPRAPRRSIPLPVRARRRHQPTGRG